MEILKSDHPQIKKPFSEPSRLQPPPIQLTQMKERKIKKEIKKEGKEERKKESGIRYDSSRRREKEEEEEEKGEK